MKISTKLLFHLLLISFTFVVNIKGLPVDDETRNAGIEARDTGSEARDTGSEALDTRSDTPDTPFENKYTLTPDTLDDKDETDTTYDKSNTDPTTDDINEDIDSYSNKPSKKIEEISQHEKVIKIRNGGKIETEDKITKRSAEVRDAVVCRCYKESNPDQVISTQFTSNFIQSNGGSTNYDIQCSGSQSSGGTVSNSGAINSQILNGDISGVENGLQLSDSAGDSANGALNQRISGDSSFIAISGNPVSSNLPNNNVDGQQEGGDIANVDISYSSDTGSNLNNFGNDQATGIENNPLGVVEVSGDTSALTGVSGDTSEIIEGTGDSSFIDNSGNLASSNLPNNCVDGQKEGGDIANVDISFSSDTGSNLNNFVNDQVTGIENNPLGVVEVSGDTSALTGVSGDASEIIEGKSALSGEMPLLTGDISIENNGQSTSDTLGSNVEAVANGENIGVLSNSEIQTQTGAEEGSFSLGGTIEDSSHMTGEVNIPNLDDIDLSLSDAQTDNEQSLDF